ncbi:MAG: phosphoribosylanthranilate isomerase [Phycisphaerales bacterium]
MTHAKGQPATRTRLKVCCIASTREANMAIAAGADALGLVARMPSGPGPIDDDLIAAIADAVPAPVATFLLTSEVDPHAVVDHIRRTRVNTVQLVDDTVGTDVYAAVRRACPAVRIVQVVHVRSAESVTLALQAARHVDTLLLDSGNPAAQVRELGGTGRVHDWSLSRAIVENSPVPAFLAGGINPSNVAQAIRQVRPFGIDLCSGVRTAGNLDPAKLTALVQAMPTPP